MVLPLLEPCGDGLLCDRVMVRSALLVMGMW